MFLLPQIVQVTHWEFLFQVLGVVSTSDGAPVAFSQDVLLKTNVYEID